MQKVVARCIKVRTLPTYQVGNKLYKSIASAARAEAWALICAKYCDGFNVRQLSDVRELHGIRCDCESVSDPDICQLHCREYGYFNRLHKRLVRLILSKYE